MENYSFRFFQHQTVWDNSQNGCHLEYILRKPTGCGRKVFKNHGWLLESSDSDFQSRFCRPVLHVRINHHGDYGYGSKYQAKSINDLRVWEFNPQKKKTISVQIAPRTMIRALKPRPQKCLAPSDKGFFFGLPCDAHALKRQSTGLHRTHLAETLQRFCRSHLI